MVNRTRTNRAVKITQDEWLGELQRLSSKKNDTGQTVPEMMKSMNMGQNRVSVLLHEARRRGWLKTGKRMGVTLDGRSYRMPVYRVEIPK